MGSRQHKNVEILREKEEKREEILKKDYGPKFKLNVRDQKGKTIKKISF